MTFFKMSIYARSGRLGHIALLRHPGQGWLDGLEPPTPLVAWLAEQVDVSSEALTRYAARGPTRSEHRRLAIRHLGLRAFLRAEHMRAAILLAARATFDTDDGGAILRRLATELKTQRFVLPSAVTLERIGLAGRARARRVAAQALNDARCASGETRESHRGWTSGCAAIIDGSRRSFPADAQITCRARTAGDAGIKSHAGDPNAYPLQGPRTENSPPPPTCELGLTAQDIVR